MLPIFTFYVLVTFSPVNSGGYPISYSPLFLSYELCEKFNKETFSHEVSSSIVNGVTKRCVPIKGSK